MRTLSLFSLILFFAAQAAAAVGLVTVPERDTVRMTVYNSVDLTLVQESRSLVLKKGLNRIQYQWAGTLIDTTSLELTPLDKKSDIEICDVIYPPHAPATLIWQVDSKIEGAVRFEISYFTSGIGWKADYVLRASPDESTANVEGWVAVSNHSGEDYPKTEVRLVVGTINLVEQIRDLATGQLSERKRNLESEANLEDRKVLRSAARMAMACDAAESNAGGAYMAIGGAAKAPNVVSARLADYHLFTISGIQAVNNDATTRFLAIHNAKPMPLEVLYRISHARAEKLYRFINDTDHFLPDGPLPDGAWQMFRVLDPGTKALSFSASTSSAYIPPKQKVELSHGLDVSLAIKQVHKQHSETDHHYNNDGRLDGWIEHDLWSFRLINTKPVPISIEYLVYGDGDWTVSHLSGERRDQRTWRHQTSVAQGKEFVIPEFAITTCRGARSKNAGAIPVVPLVPTTGPLPRIHTNH